MDSKLNTLSVNKAFTLLELIIVIIIIAVLAAVGLSTYTNQMEYSRSAEARASVSTMRKLAYEYYLKNGSLTDIQSSDVGVNGACSTTHFYKYFVGGGSTSTCVRLLAQRCTAGGKTPNGSDDYAIILRYYPGTGATNWFSYSPSGGSSYFFGFTQSSGACS